MNVSKKVRKKVKEKCGQNLMGNLKKVLREKKEW